MHLMTTALARHRDALVACHVTTNGKNKYIMRMINAVLSLAMLAVQSAALAQSNPQASRPADDYPQKPVRVIVGFSTGGGPDVVARVIAQKLGEAFGQQFIVENRLGAGGNIAAELVAKAPPDGLVLLVADIPTLAINAHLYSSLPFNTLRDLTPVSLGALIPMWLVVHPSVPANSIPELVALAKSRPVMLPYASAGSGTIIHIAMENFKSQTGANFLHIPFKGAGQSAPALLSGEVSLGFVGFSTTSQAIKAGRLRVLAVSTGKRSALTPEVPTIAESGVPGFDMAAVIGLLAPGDTPNDIVVRLNRAVSAGIRSRDAIERFAGLGMEPLGGSPEQFSEFLRADYARFGRLIKEIGLRLD